MRKVTWAEIAEFEKDYAFKVLAHPDYRYGQAFLNYFPEVSRTMTNDGDLGAMDEQRLFYTTDKIEAQAMIDRWREL